MGPLDPDVSLSDAQAEDDDIAGGLGSQDSDSIDVGAAHSRPRAAVRTAAVGRRLKLTEDQANQLRGRVSETEPEYT